MNEFKSIKAAAVVSAAAILLLAGTARARSNNKPSFEYVAGTESLPQGCGGKLEITENAMIFRCSDTAVSVPYDAITKMEFQPRVSKRIRKMKLDWVIRPSSSRSKHEGFFTVLYSDKGRTHALILKVPDDTMRPYMAEIDLRTGQAIDSRRD